MRPVKYNSTGVAGHRFYSNVRPLIDAQDRRGNTRLMNILLNDEVLASERAPEALRLIKKGADTSLISHEGLSAPDIVQRELLKVEDCSRDTFYEGGEEEFEMEVDIYHGNQRYRTTMGTA